MSQSGPNCWQCRFFAVSWDPKFPYRCDAMGFKSQALPAVQVLQIDGRPCQSFQPKPTGSMGSDRPHQRPKDPGYLA